MKTLLAAAALAALTLSAAPAWAGPCAEAKEEAESAADDLESAARQLMSCASSDDFSDDCFSEFLRVQSAHSDYDSAVSEVSSECD
jgi:hypothetical protein